MLCEQTFYLNLWTRSATQKSAQHTNEVRWMRDKGDENPPAVRLSIISTSQLDIILPAPAFNLVCSNFSPCLLHLFIKPKPNLTFNILMSSDHQTLHKYPVEWPTIPYNKGRQTTAVSFAQKYSALYNLSFSSVLTILFALWHLKSPPESQSCTTTFTQMVSHSAYVYVWGICWTFGENG